MAFSLIVRKMRKARGRVHQIPSAPAYYCMINRNKYLREKLREKGIMYLVYLRNYNNAFKSFVSKTRHLENVQNYVIFSCNNHGHLKNDGSRSVSKTVQ